MERTKEMLETLKHNLGKMSVKEILLFARRVDGSDFVGFEMAVKELEKRGEWTSCPNCKGMGITLDSEGFNCGGHNLVCRKCEGRGKVKGVK